jgi:ubiquinone/menaquinone biosynthesis C-methylase UbiE
MKTYTQNNKLAWEEAFDKRKEDYGNDLVERIKNERTPYLEDVLVEELKNYDLKNKHIAQFCCNNGRELFSLMNLGASSGLGIDIAENMIEFANDCSKQLNMNCRFIAQDLLELDHTYDQHFDFIIMTTGALPWFKDLNSLFTIVSRCLKENGLFILSEIHPFTGMLAMEGEENYDSQSPKALQNSYFKTDPWIENNGMGYMSDSNQDFTKTFTSFSHTLSDIINALISSNLQIIKLNEYDQDFSSSFDQVNHQGFPLSYILISQKRLY